MSVWGDLRKGSSGEVIRREDYILSKEEYSILIIEELKKDSCRLENILGSFSKRLELPDNAEDSLFKIEDEGGLLSADELLLLQTSLILPFYLLKGFSLEYSSLEDILIRGGVCVIIDPRTPKNKGMRNIPSELEGARRYWKRRVEENPNDDFAKRMLDEVEEEIAKWEETIILGLYSPTEKIILLFPNNMKKVAGSKEMPMLLVSTLAHEVMHAYFDRSPLETYPYVYSVEEPMAEFGMLLYLKETYQTEYLNWAKGFVSSKKTCYRYGSALMEQCEKEGASSQTRKDFELYKIAGSTFTFHLMSSVRAKPAKTAPSSAKRYKVYDTVGDLIGDADYIRYIPLITIRDYCDSNSGITYSDLNKLFNTIKCYNVARYPGIVIPKKEVDAYEADLIAKGKKPNTRVHNSPITLASGEVIYVTTEWAKTGPKDNFSDFIKIAKKLGYTIK